MVNIIRRYSTIVHPGYVVGNYYSTWEDHPANAAIPAADVLYFYPWRLDHRITIKSFHLRTGTGGAASAVKSGLWADSPVSHRPLGAPLIADNTGVATTGNNTTTSADITDTAVGPGWYWFGSKATGTLPTTFSVPVNHNYMGFYFGTDSTPGPLVVNNYSIADTYADALPTIAEGASFTEVTTGGVPIVHIGV